MSFGRSHNTFKYGLLSATALFPMFLITAWTASAAETTNVQNSQGLEQIVVTARKRSENLQEAPMAVVAFSEKMVRERNILRIQDINALAPNLTIETGAGVAGAASFVMRGIGSYDYELYADSPVSFYVDGVLWARPHTVNGEMFDIDRIEVLYGPQGTLFGRNTTAGAISVHTKQPTDAFGFDQTLGYGSFNEFKSKTVVNTGSFAGGKLKAKFGYFHSQADGWQRDLNTSPKTSPGARSVNSTVAQLHGDPSDKLSFDFRFDWRRIDYIPTAYELVDVSPDLIHYYAMSPENGGNPFVYTTDRKIIKNIYQSNGSPGSDEENWGTSFTINYQHSKEFNLKNIAAYRKMVQFTDNDPGGQGFMYGPVVDPVTFMPAGIQAVTPLTALTNNREHQISDELQATGDIGQFNYVVGLFYFEEKAHGRQFTYGTAVLPGGDYGLNFAAGRDYMLTTKSSAAYGQLSYRPSMFNDRLEITGGLRYTHDDKSFSQDLYANNAYVTSQALAKTWNNVSKLVSLKYKITDHVNTYARYSTGYKAGGFNPGVIQQPYNPEKVESFEIGVKSEFWDNRVMLNLSAFHTNYNDLQTTQYVQLADGTQGNSVLNAARAKYDGLEAEFAVKPTEDLRLDVGVGLIDPKYRSFMIEDSVTHLEKDISSTAKFQLLSKQSYHIGASYHVSAVKLGYLTASADYTYKSKRYWYAVPDFNPRNEIIAGNAAKIVTAHINWAEIPLAGSGARLNIGLHGYNLLNQNLIEAGADLGSLGAGFINFAPPRRFMLEMTVSY